MTYVLPLGQMSVPDEIYKKKLNKVKEIRVRPILAETLLLLGYGYGFQNNTAVLAQ